MPLIQITAPAGYPVTASEVAEAARADGTEFDAQLAIIIPAMTAQAEALTGRLFYTRTMELVMDAFPECAIDLLLPDASEIVSVVYLDANGVQQTLAQGASRLAAAGLQSRLEPAWDTAWPETREVANAVRIRFKAGYGVDATAVPQSIRLWIIAHCIQALENPEGLGGQFTPLPYADSLLDPHRVVRV